MTGRFAENGGRDPWFCRFAGVNCGVRHYEGSVDEEIHHESWRQAGKMAFTRRPSRISFLGNLRLVTPFCINTAIETIDLYSNQNK
jgi:hypothetical protein